MIVKRRKVAILFGMLVWLMSAGLTRAANYNDAADGNWSEAATWGGGGYPASAADNAVIDSHLVTLDGILSIGSLTINATAGRLDTAGHTLTLTGGFVFSRGLAAGAGTIVVTNSMLTMSTLDYGPTNATTIDLYGGGYLSCSAFGRRIWNNGTIRLLSGTLTNASLRALDGTGVWYVATGALFRVTTTGGESTDFVINGSFHNHGSVISSNAAWRYGSLTTGSGTHGGSFIGRGFNFGGTHIFLSGSSVQADQAVTTDSSIWRTGSSLSASNLTVRNSGRLETEAPLSLQSFNCGTPCFITSDVPITCSGPFTWASGVLSGSGPITTALFQVTLAGGGVPTTNRKAIVALQGGSFDSLHTGSKFWNHGSILLAGGEWKVISGKWDLLLGTGTLTIGPDAVLHRLTSTSTLLHENPTTNAGTIKATTGTINFTGGMVQTATGALRGNGGILAGTLTIDGGCVAPGDTAGAAGSLKLSDTVNLSAGAAIAVELGGTTATNQYDRLHGGAINLNGCALEVTFIDGFQSAVQNGDVFTPILGNLTGAFGNVAGGRVATSDGKGTFAVAVTTGTGGSVVLSDFQAAGPPGTVIVIR